MARELTQLGHQESSMGTAATMLMFHTGAVTAAALEGMGPEVGGQARSAKHVHPAIDVDGRGYSNLMPSAASSLAQR
jgi:hypothetical protein